MEEAHVLAAADSYNFGFDSESDSRIKLITSGWRVEQEFIDRTLLVMKDAALLWVRNDECILAFKGSDDLNDLVHDMDDIMVNYHGFSDVAHGVKVELDALLSKILSQNGREVIAKRCSKYFGLAGHGLGGASAQLLAAVINKKNNPLEFPRGVDAVYVIGSMSASRSPLTNDQEMNGCFKGRNLFNAEFRGNSVPFRVDTAFHYPNSDFKHSYLARAYMQDDKLYETSCDSKDDYALFASGTFDIPDTLYGLHAPDLYIKNVEKNSCKTTGD